MLGSLPMPTAASLPETARPEVAGDSEFGRLLRSCDPGAALAGPLTFAFPAGKAATRKTWLAAWQQWRETLFEPVLAPALAAAAVQAQQGHAREMLALDAELNSRLGSLAPEIATRSSAAGGRLLRQLHKARGDRWLGKFAVCVAAGKTPAHFAIVYAGQSAFFHLPLRLLLPTYAYWEWSAALAACSMRGLLPDFTVEAAEWQRLVDANISPTPFNPADALPNNAGRVV